MCSGGRADWPKSVEKTAELTNALDGLENTLNIRPTGNLPTVQGRSLHPEVYSIFFSIYHILKEMESYNNDLTIHTDEVQTEVTRTWVFSVYRKLPEGGEFGRRRRSRAIRSILSSVNNQQPISVTVFGESSMKKLSEIIQDTIRRINNSGKYKESSENVDLNDCFIPEAYTYTLPEKLFFLLLPQYSMVPTYVTIDGATLIHLLQGTNRQAKNTSNFSEVAKIYNKVFKLPVPTLNDPTGSTTKIFMNVIRTNGVVIDFIYAVASGRPEDKLPDLQLKDFTASDLCDFHLWAIDPGV